MSHVFSHSAVILTVAALGAGCASTEMLDEPLTIELEQPLAESSDDNLEVLLDWVVVRDGPGAWAANTNWDEYMLRIRNLSSETVRIDSLVVYDFAGHRVESDAVLPELIRESKKTAKRYREQNIDVTAGIGGTALIYAGGAAAVGSMAAVYASLTPFGVASTGVATAGLGLLIAAPVLMVGGAQENLKEDQVAVEVVRRTTPLPTLLGSGLQKSVVRFFPLVPSPTRIELTYSTFSGQHTLVFESLPALSGLHINESSD